MIDTDLSLLLALILFVVLIVFDLAFFRFRKEFDQNEPEFSLVDDAVRRLKKWIGDRKKPQLNEPLAEGAESATTAIEPLETEPAASTGAQDFTVSQAPISENGTDDTGHPTVRVRISADIPEGTVVHITMEAVGGKGKVSIQRNTIAAAKSIVVAAETRSKITPVPGQQALKHALSKIRQGAEALISKLKNRKPNLQRDLFWAAIIVYALVVSIGIDHFPIYFFTDEAIHMNMASDFLSNGFKNYYGEFLPTFFSVEGWVNGTSVYVQLIPYLLFGKSVMVTRLVSAFITLLGATALGLLLKQVFKIKYYWAGIFLLITIPVWFLHARTAFEYAEVGAFYCIFLYLYGRYRKGDLRSLYYAVVAGALCFYTHGLGEILMGVTGLALFIVDFRYHIHPKRRKTVLLGLGLAIILLLPFARYYLAHPAEAAEQVKRRGSYWSNTGLTLSDKILDFFGQYTLGLNPWYWYSPVNHIDLDRHRMLGYGNGLWFTFPFALAGLFQIFKSVRKPIYRFAILALLAFPILPSTIINGFTEDGFWKIRLWFPEPVSIPVEIITKVLWISIPFLLLGILLAFIHIRKPAHRLALVALLACPIPASVAAIGMPRMLWMSVPLAILSAIGLSAIIEWGEKRLKTSSVWPAWALFAALTFLSAYMLRDGLVNGPLWFPDYTLYGMQYGARQVFEDTVRPALEKDPNLKFIVSPSWANGTEKFVSFFIPEGMQSRVTMGQPTDHDYLDNLSIFTSDILFISTANEYNKLFQEPVLFKDVNVIQIIPYPNGEPGFYVISLTPVDNINEIVAAQHQLNRTPVEDTMLFNNETIRVVHSPLGSGNMENVFDNNPDSLATSLEANPFVINLFPLRPIDTHSVFIKTGSAHDYTITIRLYAPGASEPVIYTFTNKDLPGKDLPPNPEFSMEFDRGPEKSERIEFEVMDNTSGETSAFELRTIQFK